MTVLYIVLLLIFTGLVTALVIWMFRGEQTVSKDTPLVDVFDDGYTKGFVAGGGSSEIQDEAGFERYTKDRKRWMR